jgi:hypothetical protein
LIGGYAVGFHGKPRATKDLDLLVSAENGNLERVARALEAFGAPPGIVATAKNLGPSEVLYLGIAPVRIDILRQAEGVDTEQVIARAVTTSLGEITIPIISIEDLVANKRAAGRHQDLADVELLERVLNTRSPSS